MAVNGYPHLTEWDLTPQLPSRSKPTKPTNLLPLVTFIEQIEIAIHEFASDAAALKIIRKNFAPDVIIEINKQPTNFDGLVSFIAANREESRFLKFVFQNAIATPSDPEGRGGTVGFAALVTLERKSDGVILQGTLVGIFEVTWFDFGGHDGKRLITKGTAAIQTPTPIS